MRIACIVYVLMTLCLFSPAPAQEEVEVKFDGDQEVALEEGEEEVVFEDEEEEMATAATVAPEHEYHSWLLVLPALCVGLLVMNVRWRPSSPEKNK